MKFLSQNADVLYFSWLLIMSLVLLLVMWRDKRRARHHRHHRTPEALLMTLGILGGAMGGILGMQLFRHKTKKMKFMVGFPILAVLQWGVAIWMLLPE